MKGDFVTITRVGTNEKYASNWDSIFGGGAGKTAAGKSSAKTGKAAKVVKKSATAKKTAPVATMSTPSPKGIASVINSVCKGGK